MFGEESCGRFFGLRFVESGVCSKHRQQDQDESYRQPYLQRDGAEVSRKFHSQLNCTTGHAMFLVGFLSAFVCSWCDRSISLQTPIHDCGPELASFFGEFSASAEYIQ